MNVRVIPVGIIGTNCYVLESKEKKCVIVDPGAQPDKIIEIVEKAGLSPKYVLLTHGHHDHIGGVNRVLDHFPEAELFIGEGDLEMLTDPDLSLASVRHQNADEFQITRAKPLTGGTTLPLDELEITVLDTPGHTKGGVTYLCGDLMFAGDTLFYRNCGRCDLYGGNYDTMLKSLKRLAELEGDYTVYPGHGQSSTLSDERKNNPYMMEACS